MYLLSLGAGVLVGVVYSLLGVRSPAPPVIALVGLLGILIGEQLIPVGQQMLAGCDVRSAWRQSACTAHLFGTLPGRIAPNAADPLSAPATKESQG
jgi:XapX domain-containing protein